MADKTAALRLDLKATGFYRGLAETAKKAKKTGAEMGKNMASGLNVGAKAGLDSVRSMFSSIKSTAMSLGGIVGGVGVSALVQDAIDADKQFRKLAFTMGAGAGKFRDYNEIQKEAQAVAKRWAQDSGKLGQALDSVFNTVGDSDFAMGTLDAIAKTSRATGEEVGTIAPIVAEMNRQFGLTAEQIDSVLPMVVSLGSRGGLSVQDLGATLGNLGRTAKISGLDGEEGLSMLLAMVNQISAASGTAEGSVEKLQIIMTKLASGQGAAFLQGIKNDSGGAVFGAEVEGLDTMERLSLVLEKARSNPRVLQQVFGEQGLFIEQAFGQFKDVGAAMREASKSGLDAADINEAAEANMKSASAGIDAALETLRQAFTKPEMMSAIESLAQNLPAMAEGIAKFVDFAVNNPALALGGLGAANAMHGGLTSAINAAMSGGGTSAGAAIGGSMNAAGKTAGATIAGQMVGAAATAAAVIGIALAADQAQKLEQDKAQARADIDQQRKGALEVAEAQGYTSARRKRNGLAEAIANKGVLGLRPQDFFDDRDEIIERDADGNMVTRFDGEPRKDAGRSRLDTSAFRDKEAAAAKSEAEQFRLMAEAENRRQDEALRQQQQNPQQTQQQSNAAARITAEAIAGKTLRVQVTNTVQTRSNASGPGGAGQPPSPGYQ